MAMTPRVSSRAAPWQSSFLRDWGGLLVIGSGLYVLAHLFWLIFGLGGPAYASFIDAIALLPISLVTIVLFWRASIPATLDRRTRWGWRVLTLALCCSWLGNAVFFYAYLTDLMLPFPSWADAAYLTYYPLLVGGIVLLPVAPSAHRLRTTVWVDAGTIVLGGGLAVWYFVLQPTATVAYATWLETVVAVAYPAGGLVTLAGIVAIAARRTTHGSQFALGVIAVGLSLFTIGDIRYGYLSLQGTYGDADWSGAMWVLGNFLLLLGAHLQYWHARRSGLMAPRHRQDVEVFNLLPYLAVAIGFGLLVYATSDLWGTLRGHLILGVSGLTILVVARQILAVRVALRATEERAALVVTTDVLTQTKSELEQRVAERTATLEQALADQAAQARMLEDNLVVQQQLNQTIATLSAPVIPIHNDTLVVPLVGALDPARTRVVLTHVVQQIEQRRARRIFVDVTGVLLADLPVAQALLDLAATTRLLGAEMVLVGIRPELAQVFVTIGADLGQLATAATLQAGLAIRPWQDDRHAKAARLPTITGGTILQNHV